MSITVAKPSRHWGEFPEGVLDVDFYDGTASWTPVAVAEDEDVDSEVVADLGWVAEFGVYPEHGHPCLSLREVEASILAAAREYTRITREDDR